MTHALQSGAAEASPDYCNRRRDRASGALCRPYQREPLPFGDLIERHLLGAGIPKPLVEVVLTPRRPRRRKVKPFVGQNNVSLDAVTPVVADAEAGLCEGVALLCVQL